MTLEFPPKQALTIACPGGIGDAAWTLTKIPDLRRKTGAKKVHLVLCGPPPYRSMDFALAFSFIDSAAYSDLRCHYMPEYTTPDGAYNWAHSQPGWHHYDYLLCANQHLERGNRLEEWLPELETDFNLCDYFIIPAHHREFADSLIGSGRYVVFYLGPEEGNTTAGHNRNGLWTIDDWRKLAGLFRKVGLMVVVVGAEYDRTYAEKVWLDNKFWITEGLGHWPITKTFAVIKRARCVVAYQSGIGIFSPFLGVPTACFWRPYGDSIRPDAFVSFSEKMATAWVPPEMLERDLYLPCIYGKCSPESVFDWAIAT